MASQPPRLMHCYANGCGCCRTPSISILQAQFSLTQVLDRPVQGRLFFEQVIGENLDLGRPQQVQLIFNRRILRHTTHAPCNAIPKRLLQERSHQKYHKENPALRTKTTINNAYDVSVIQGPRAQG